MRRRRFARRAARFAVVAVGVVVLLVAAAVGVFLATRYTAGAPHEGMLALTGATVLVGEGLEPRSGVTVLVRDGIIVDVGPAAAVGVPAGADILEVDGLTVMPGLVDLHVHLGAPAIERGQEVGGAEIPGIIFDAVRHVPDARRALLDHGVTAVRSLGDDHAWILELRGLVRDGELEGPRVFAAGPLFTTRGGHPVVTIGVEPESDTVRLPTTPAAARRAVRALTGEDGVDLIKVVQERGNAERPLEPIAADVLQAIVAEAHEQGVPVTAHWGTVEDLADVLDAGVDGLEHVEARGALDGWPDGLVASLVERDIAITPTLAVTDVALPPDVHRQLRQRVGEVHAAGGRIVAGSDAGMPGVAFGGGLHRELELLVDSGLSPREALRAATSGAARVLRTDQIGAIAPGRAADLVVVDGDPLRDIRAARDVVVVLRDGRTVVDRRDDRGR